LLNLGGIVARRALRGRVGLDFVEEGVVDGDESIG